MVAEQLARRDLKSLSCSTKRLRSISVGVVPLGRVGFTDNSSSRPASIAADPVQGGRYHGVGLAASSRFHLCLHADLSTHVRSHLARYARYQSNPTGRRPARHPRTTKCALCHYQPVQAYHNPQARAGPCAHGRTKVLSYTSRSCGKRHRSFDRSHTGAPQYTAVCSSRASPRILLPLEQFDEQQDCAAYGSPALQNLSPNFALPQHSHRVFLGRRRPQWSPSCP